MERIEMIRVVGGLRYDTEKATLIAHNVFWDGSNWERYGRNTWLYRTPSGRYFAVYGTLWQGERNRLEPLSVKDAVVLYEVLPEHEVEFEDAFPSVEVQDA